MSSIKPRTRPVMLIRCVAFTILGVFVACWLCLVDVILPSARTITSIEETAYRIGIYFRQNKKLPANLNLLPRRENYANSIVDDRKRPLKYAVISVDSFVLSTQTLTNEADASRKFSIVNGDVVDYIQMQLRRSPPVSR